MRLQGRAVILTAETHVFIVQQDHDATSTTHSGEGRPDTAGRQEIVKREMRKNRQ